MRTPSPQQHALVQARRGFAQMLGRSLEQAAESGYHQLIAQSADFATARQAQELQEAIMEFRNHKEAWLQTARREWAQLLENAAKPGVTSPPRAFSFEIEQEHIIERKIRATRLSEHLLSKIANTYGDLRLRVMHIEDRPELATQDIFVPLTFCLACVTAWDEAGLSAQTWQTIIKSIEEAWIPSVAQSYDEANAVLVAAGVLPTIDFRALIRRSAEGAIPASTASPAPPGSPSPMPSVMAGSQAHTTDAAAPPTLAQQAANIRHSAARVAGQELQQVYPGGLGTGYAASALTGSRPATVAPGVQGPATGQGFANSINQWLMDQTGAPPSSPASGSGPSPASRAPDSSANPASRMRQGARHIAGQVGALLRNASTPSHPAGTLPLSDALPTAFSTAAGGGAHPDIQNTAADAQATTLRTVMGSVAEAGVVIPAGATPAQAVALLKEHSASLKRKAATNQEKATIEIVALMFQSILSEDRISDRIRLLIARLQMPVIRVALAEPAFFDSLDHPARKLIDRMGACVMGLDGSTVSDKALEAELLRVVQMVEQYAETGTRVFKLVLGEFEAFLKKHLSGSEASRKVAGVAQQIEQREALAIQYTIEIRNLIRDFTISDIVREFLLKTWSEVLAVSAVRFGKDHETTLTHKDVTTRLVWAAGAKPNRADRARMIAEMPGLLLQLRAGMELIALPAEVLEGRIKILGDALTEAFKNKSDAIAADKLREMSDKLQNLEEFFTEDNLGDLPIDAETIELMLELDAQALTVLTEAVVEPSEASRAWAQELELGCWFNFNFREQLQQVQYAWHSDMKQLFLFANLGGKSILMSAGALAAHLQTGQLAALEEESLSVRATRDALTKLHANPEQLLG